MDKTVGKKTFYKWERFGKYYSGVPWKYIIEMDVGHPTKKEKERIIELGLYNSIIDPSDTKQFPII
jgi:hypothetical protein